MIFKIQNNQLNYFEKNCKIDYQKYIELLEGAKSREMKKKSILYIKLMKEAINNFKEDSDYSKIVYEIEKNFKEFKRIFSPDEIYKVNKK